MATNWKEIWDELSVSHVPDDWNMPDCGNDPLKMVKSAADHITTGLGSLFSGSAPDSAKKAMDFAAIPETTMDDLAVAVNADGILTGSKVSFGKPAVSPGPTEITYYVAAQTSRAAELHMKIRDKGRALTFTDTYQGLIDEGVISEGDLPQLLKVNPMARFAIGFPLGEKTYLEGLGYVTNFLWDITDGLHSMLFSTSGEVRAKRAAGLIQRIPEEYRKSVLTLNTKDPSAAEKATLSKAIAIHQYLVDQKEGRAELFTVDFKHSSTTPHSLVALEWILKGAVGLLKLAFDAASWAFNADISGAIKNAGEVTEQDILNMEKMVRDSYTESKTATWIANDTSINHDLKCLDRKIFIGTTEDDYTEYSLEKGGSAGTYLVKRNGSHPLSAQETLLIISRTGSFKYMITIPKGVTSHFVKVSLVREVPGGEPEGQELDQLDPSANPGVSREFTARPTDSALRIICTIE
ncbi:hypothetical protein [Streptomyces wuyuanensis]|uniref:hypothetical protein n=1 Tax=Streptomyces wuyuanensis TaxID=1196353 RepID=UPI00343D15FD